MERKTNKGLIALGVIFIILGLVSEVTVFSGGGTLGALPYVCAITMAIALIMALIYLLKGYEKKDAKLYKLFLLFFGIATLLDIVINTAASATSPAFFATNTAFLAISFGAICALYFAKDLGKKLSCQLALAPIIFNIILLIDALMAFGGTDILITLCMIYVRHIILGAVLYISVRSKYADKDARGTK